MKEFDPLLFGKKLRSYRLDAGLTQREAAAAVGVGRVQWANLERGKHTPPVHRLFKIACILQVTTDELLGLH